jgi:hypothetical protein
MTAVGRRTLAAGLLLLGASTQGCGPLPLLPSVEPASTPFDLFPAATLELSFDLDDPSFAFPGPTWQLPDVPAETLVPLVGPAPQ